MSGFLTRTIARVRKFTDEPSTNAKYSDADILDLIRTSWAMVWEEIARVDSMPLVVRHDIPVSSATALYELPPTVGQILQFAKIDASSGIAEWRLEPRSRWNPVGPQVLFEGRTVRFEPQWQDSSTLRLDYIPTGDVAFHEGVAGTVTNNTTANTATVVLAASPTTGTLDNRPNAYAGCVLRILTATTNNYEQERMITAYDVTTRTATVAPAFPAAMVPGGATVTYEVAPILGAGLDVAVALDVSQIICGLEGDPKRAASIQLQYSRVMRTVRLNAANMEAIVGQRFQHDVAQGINYFRW